MRALAAKPSSLRECGAALATAILSTLWFFRALLLDRGAIPGDLGDGRLIPFLLEHGWRWLRRDALHRDLWTLPIFYPGGAGSFAYSDVLLSFAPPYWLARAAGAAPFDSYRLWILAIGVSNCLAAWLLLRWGLRASRTAAALTAPLACFSASRLFQIQHAQLWPMFYPLLAACALLLYWRAESPDTRRLALAGGAGAIVLQLYGAIYHAFFALLLGVILLAVLLCRPATRAVLRRRWARDARAIAVCVLVAAFALAPLALAYARAARDVHARHWRQVAELLPRPASWIFVAPNAPFSSWTLRAPPFAALPHADEQALGLGYLTPLLAAAGLAVSRRRSALRIAALTMAIAAFLVTSLPGGFAPWLLAVRALPILGVVRAMSRIGLFLPTLAAAAIATLFDGLPRRGRPWIAALALAVVGEQSVRLSTYDIRDAIEPVRTLAARVERSASGFFVATRRRDLSQWLIHLDAMWATLETGRPTVNGYSGNLPRGWGDQLWLARSGPGARDRRLRADLATWTGLHGATANAIQVIELGRDYRPSPRQKLRAPRGATRGGAPARAAPPPAPGPAPETDSR